jgi:SPP1 family phage portal protein
MYDKYVKMIDAQGFTPEIIGKIINDHKRRQVKMLLDYKRYKTEQDGVPIYSRQLPETSSKVNNRLANDWFGEIVDTKTGYMFGVPVDISVDKDVPNHEEMKKVIDRFRKVNNFDDLNSEVGKFAAICGYDVLLAYIDPDGIERVMRMNPWECCIITETEISEPAYAIRFFQTYDKKTRIECYDKKRMHVFIGSQGGAFARVEEESRDTMFDFCPMLGVPNNAELRGDGEPVFSIIDAYDRTMSDYNSEIEQFRLAYMLFYGVRPTQELIDDMIQTGALYVSATSKEDSPNKIEFLTKQINNAALDSHLDRLEANIVRFAKHVNFSDAAFGGDITGPAMRFKLFMLESKAKPMERKHQAAMMYLFKVLGSAWRRRAVPNFDYTALEFKYTRNIPVNTLDEAQTAAATLGITSRRTTLKALKSLVPDVDEELRQIDEEKQGGPIDLDDPTITGGTDGPEETAASGSTDGTPAADTDGA